MSHSPGLPFTKASVAPHHFAELSVVSLARPIEFDGRILREGSRGTVVGAYSGGIGYEVEFFEPFHAVVTLESCDLKA